MDSALCHLRPLLTKGRPCRVIHVGDGAHARTGALFSLKREAGNISVDPLLNVALVEAWRERFGIRRLAWHKASLDDVADQLNALPPMPVFVTFVHAHVHMDRVLDRLRWDAAFTLACCLPGHQFTQTRIPLKEGIDPSGAVHGTRSASPTSTRTGLRAPPWREVPRKSSSSFQRALDMAAHSFARVPDLAGPSRRLGVGPLAYRERFARSARAPGRK
ncbi:hypothetical protein WMF04_01280 [Sorangium sp. So ce260]|uniref:hypothetical protein n=1 Tax=Sorangium sp. So ce260 TaxID=3133291 RepID=UPI003F5D7721